MSLLVQQWQSDNAILFVLNAFEFYRYIKMLMLLPEFYFIFFKGGWKIEERTNNGGETVTETDLFKYIEMDKRNSKSQWTCTRTHINLTVCNIINNLKRFELHCYTQVVHSP